MSWSEELPIAITVTDADGVIVEMNARARETFAKNGGGTLVGQSVFAGFVELSVVIPEELAHFDRG